MFGEVCLNTKNIKIDSFLCFFFRLYPNNQVKNMYSTQSQNKSSRGHSMVKTFCKVCFDSGKSEKEYTSHFVRASPDPMSKVCCPVLLSMECQFCHLKGHMVSKCTRRMKMESRNGKSGFVHNDHHMIVVKKDVKSRFAILDVDVDDDVEVVCDDSISTMVTASLDTDAVFSYRDALIQPEKKKSMMEADMGSISTTQSLRNYIKYSRPGSWADASDSDDE